MKFFLISYAMLFILLSSMHTLMAQSPQHIHSKLIWLHYYNQLKLNEQWVWMSDAGYRHNIDLNQSIYIVRTGIGYAVSSNIRLATGLAVLGAAQTDLINFSEIRPYQDVQLMQNLGRIKLEHRLRLEERFRKAESHFSTYNSRLRYRIFFTYSLLDFPTNPAMNLSLNAGDEIFINYINDDIPNVFDLNRLLFGLALKMSPSLTATCMYNYQYSEIQRNNLHKNDHVIWLSLRHTVDRDKFSK